MFSKKHEPYKRIVSGADTAILFIHGIAGTPNQFRPLVSQVPESVSVYNILLDGHGKNVRDFSRTSMKKWEAQTADAVTELRASHKKVYIAAHSMGTLFAIEQGIKNPDIAGLFLLAVPIKVSLKPRMFVNAMKVYFDIVKPEDVLGNAAKNSYGIAQDKNALHYLGWIPRYLELFAKIRRTRKLLHAIKVPCRAYQSAYDEMVSVRSVQILRRNSDMQVHVLERSGHFYYEQQDLNDLIGEFRTFIR